MAAHRKYSDRELVEGCIRNDRSSQEVLYRTYFSGMMAMCMRYTQDREQAMDIVNNGFLRVFQKLHTFAFRGSLEGWIRRLVWHSLSDHFKRNSKYLQFMVFEDRDQGIRSEALDNVYAEDILKLVDKLPPATQEVFKLYAIEGFTHVEIAKKVDISVGTSKWHLSAARKKLKTLIQKTYQYNLYAG